MSEETLTPEQMLAEIGMKLRAAREANEISLTEFANRTRIQKRYLEKVELGQIGGLPNFSFVRGFIRNYMQELQLEDQRDRRLPGADRPKAEPQVQPTPPQGISR